MTGINISGMYQIAEHHQLVIRACDIDIETLAPSLEHIKRLANEKWVLLFYNVDKTEKFKNFKLIFCKYRALAVC